MPRRQSIHIGGFSHENPIPAGSRIGPFLFSGALTGRDPQTREMPTSLAEQCANAFHHVRALLRAAGGSVDDIVKMTFWLVDYRDREALNAQWLAMFPDAASRPARHTMAAQLDRGALIQCDLVAVLPDSPL
ncbi:RidA family protein [Microbacterium protaetiae]|uniref:RidA family protein n=1 Tax=Microbacterium protaetiae TaxID=2509458 RepID=A0A4P6EC83_9MICO|nr:RidA family protein [Microbacterium protaetiae]QAY59830.1 RidA family protein [Microbacterium protaetiae]